MNKIGIVGARGLSGIMGFNAYPDTKVTALCDLNQDLLEAEAKKYDIPNTYRVYEDMLESDIDIVVVATPMQLHVAQAIAALESGRHVLSEVTCGVTMDELWWLTETVEKSKKTYMMAENYCYIPQMQQVAKMSREGIFGDIYFAEGEYLHDIKDLATYPNGKTSWRKFWQLGKRGVFYPTHSLGPVMKCFNSDRIKSVICVGTGWHTAPEFRQEDTSVALCTLESGKLVKVRVDCISDRPHNMSYYSIQGTKGCYEAPRGFGDDHKVWIRKEGQKDGAKWCSLDMYNKYMPERYKNATEEQKRQSHWGGDFFIIQDFMDAVTKGTKPYVDVYEACEWTAVALLSEISAANSGRLMQMPDFRKAKSYRDQELKL